MLPVSKPGLPLAGNAQPGCLAVDRSNVTLTAALDIVSQVCNKVVVLLLLLLLVLYCVVQAPFLSTEVVVPPHKGPVHPWGSASSDAALSAPLDMVSRVWNVVVVVVVVMIESQV